MEKLNQALATVLEKIGNVSGALHAAQRVVKHQHRVWEQAKEKEERFGKRADRERKDGHPKRARDFDARAAKQHRKAEAAKLRAQPAIADVKRLAQRLHDLSADADQLRDEVNAAKQEHGVTITGNKATGGTRRERLKVVALQSAAMCASGRRANFYSQAGTWDVEHCLSGEARGHRSDCSSWFTSVYRSALLPDPNRNGYGGGYTGTLLAAGKSVSRSDLKPGDAVIYGSGTGFHVEMYVGPGQKTIGHGSAPVDPGIVDLVPGAVQRFRSYM